MADNDSVNLPGNYVPPEYEAIGREFFDDLDQELEPVNIEELRDHVNSTGGMFYYNPYLEEGTEAYEDAMYEWMLANRDD
jgi:hypothetical protein